YRRPAEARLHGARAPAKAEPLVRRLPVPVLGDRDQVGIAVVVEVDDTAERVDDAADAAERVIVNREVVAIAVFDLHTAKLAIDLREAQFGAVRRMDQQR